MSIQKRLAGSYFAVILVTVAILEMFLIITVRYYYFHNVERILLNQAELSASIFQTYFSADDLEQQSERLLSGFSHQSTAQVQIIGKNGELLQDSIDFQPGALMSNYPDVQEAGGGDTGIWRGQDPTAQEQVMAVSVPLLSEGAAVGIVRYVTSLTETERTVRQIMIILLTAGLIVVAIVTVLSIFLSRTITGPVKELKRAAERMAEGDFTVRAEKRYRDELGTLTDTLNTMAGTIMRNEELKNDFISSVSHELRTPLTSVKGWAVTLQDDRGEDKQMLEEGLHIIEAETDRLTRLVDDLLDFSKFNEGQIILAPVRLQVGDWLEQLGKQLAPRAERLRIKLEVQIESGLPVVKADPNRLKQVLINLLDNSFKFTSPQGTILVRACAAGSEIILSVEDTGSGIPEQDLAHVFQRFYKGSNAMPGSGLGLPISNHIVELHGGRMQIESRCGTGTKVEVHLPV
ncbi:sensor histidine kinase [Paenibacillus pinihumi]|uniref:sensor histidine kinase n=1 Tax=Paenibacillus pinihumi TaxID=669462 RepID=UPI00040338FA|nr:HAMP domain-containing sensor histidine kinase [Paenibacillus pinihumi]